MHEWILYDVSYPDVVPERITALVLCSALVEMLWSKILAISGPLKPSPIQHLRV